MRQFGEVNLWQEFQPVVLNKPPGESPEVFEQSMGGYDGAFSLTSPAFLSGCLLESDCEFTNDLAG
jgi:hypothetical protein